MSASGVEDAVAIELGGVGSDGFGANPAGNIASSVAAAVRSPLSAAALSATATIPLIKILTGRKFSNTMIAFSVIMMVVLVSAAIFLYFGANLPPTVRFVAVGGSIAGAIGYLILSIYIKKVKELGPLKVLAREIAAEAANIERVNQELISTESRLQSLAETIHGEEERLSGLRQQFEDTQSRLTKSATALEETAAELDRIETHFQQMQEKLESTTTELTKLKETKTELNTQVASLMEKVRSLQSICTQFSTTVDLLKTEFDQNNRTHSSLIDREETAITRLVELTHAMAILKELEKNSDLKDVIASARVIVERASSSV